MTGKRAVFLDRDGVINRSIIKNGKPYPPASLDELEVLPGVANALERLHDAGFRLIVVTNQPDVARGTQTRETVDVINNSLRAQLVLDEFRVCCHDDAEHCSCRKPRPGMLLDAAKDHHIDLAASYMIGDRWRDIEAGEHAGCVTIFVDHGYQEQQPQQFRTRVRSLAEAADWILSNKGGKG